MWMTDYIREVKKQFRDLYGFKPTDDCSPDDPVYEEGKVPDGVYPMIIEGKMDFLEIKCGKINCCNEKPKGPLQYVG